MQWEVVIGLETHAQLATRSKAFSGASTRFGAEPNTQACPLDLALPGTLPVMNRAAVECAIRFGLAVGAQIAPRSVFARKNYFYPDLPKGYQISQYELPVVVGGSLDVVWDEGGETRHKTVQLTRAHLEEDAGKSLHEDFHGMTGIDLNRAGTPLLEIVTEPDMRSAREAVAYARTLHALVVWLGICDGNMQEGSFRCDANVSVRPMGQAELGTRSEIKNLNSFRFLERAIDFEVRRQIELIEDGGRVVQETRLYDPDRDETRSMRSKEDAHDYRYFPDPDLPTLVIEPEWVAAAAASLPELPVAMRARLMRDHALGEYDAAVLTGSRDIAQYFDAVLAALGAATRGAAGAVTGAMTAVESGADVFAATAKFAANWVSSDLAAAVNRDGIGFADCPVKPAQLAALVGRIADGTISGKIAKEIFAKVYAANDTSADAGVIDRIIDEQGLRQISDGSELERIVDAVLAANPKSVEEFRAGKEKAFNALVGQAMKATRGKANPQQVSDLLRRKLAG